MDKDAAACWCPGLLCSPRLYAPQVAALADEAEIVVPDWRRAPLSIWDSWDKAARWVVDQMPAGKFALAGLSLGGMMAVEIMQFAAERVTKLALLDTGMRGQNAAERPSAAPASGWPTRAISSWCWACRCRASSRPTACPTRRWSTR